MAFKSSKSYSETLCFESQNEFTGQEFPEGFLLTGTGGTMKKLEDMNLMDDFLANSLTAHKTYGEEAARYILECILQRRIRHLTVIPQKAWYGETPTGHGIRLDVYLDEEDGELFDLETDNNSGSGDMAALPRRVRFYHAKIDAGNMAAGEDYSTLRNVLVIFISSYDPFKRNRMVYTVKNGCVEAPDLPYDDGLCTMFLYTKGTEGNPPEQLRQLVRYMEHSVKENAQSKDLARLHQMVTEVKSDRKVGLAYMKAYEVEERIKKTAWKEGLAQGTANSVLALLAEKGTVPARLKERIYTQADTGLLEQWLLSASKAASVEDFQARTGLES